MNTNIKACPVLTLTEGYFDCRDDVRDHGIEHAGSIASTFSGMNNYGAGYIMYIICFLNDYIGVRFGNC